MKNLKTLIFGTVISFVFVQSASAQLETQIYRNETLQQYQLVPLVTGPTVVIRDPPQLITAPLGASNRLSYYKPIISSNFKESGFQCLIYFDSPNVLTGQEQISLNNCINAPVQAGKTLDGFIVTGHTDTFKPELDSMADSRQIAQVVSDYIRSAYANQTVVERARGETDPFVLTGNGVREQMNRRVEVLVYVR